MKERQQRASGKIVWPYVCTCNFYQFIHQNYKRNERLWPIINQPISNQTFENLSQVKDIVNYQCIHLLKQPLLP